MSGPVAVELEELPAEDVEPRMSPTSSLSALCVEVTMSFINDDLDPGTAVRSASAMLTSVIARIAMVSALSDASRSAMSSWSIANLPSSRRTRFARPITRCTRS
jgi:hypothetical protein